MFEIVKVNNDGSESVHTTGLDFHTADTGAKNLNRSPKKRDFVFKVREVKNDKSE